MGVTVGLAISPQGLEQRFSEAASACLYQVLRAAVAQAIQAEGACVPLWRRFNGVYLEDSSVVTLPDELADKWTGCGGSGSASKAAVKMQVRWDMLHGELDGPYLTAGRTHDRAATELNRPLPAGSLNISDLGYWKLDRLAEMSAAG